MNFDTQHDIIQSALSGQRGGFAATLADAWTRADSNNRARLEAAFPDILLPAKVVHTICVKMTVAAAAAHPVHDYSHKHLIDTLASSMCLRFGPSVQLKVEVVA